MENEKDKIGISFKDYLDKSTNLVTLFGVFNALFIYSATLDSKDAAEFMLPSFFILSMFVWLELILFTLSSNDGSKKYEFFLFLLCTIEFGLAYYFIVKFSGLLILLALFGIFFIFFFLFMRLLTWLSLTRFVNTKKFKRKSYLFILMITSILLSGVTMKILFPLVQPVLEKLVPSNVVKTDK